MTRRTGITADELAAVISRGLGEGVEVVPDGGSEVRVRKGLRKAKVTIDSESGGTEFRVSGVGTFFVPTSHVITRLVNDRGIAKRTAEVIGRAQELAER